MFVKVRITSAMSDEEGNNGHSSVGFSDDVKSFCAVHPKVSDANNSRFFK